MPNLFDLLLVVVLMPILGQQHVIDAEKSTEPREDVLDTHQKKLDVLVFLF